MRKAILFALLTTCFCGVKAQIEDPVIMTINGEDILRSEFEYSYNKNNSEGVIDKKTVEEYVDLFINYKLKVAAAVDANLDTLPSFRKDYTKYRDLQVWPTMVTNEDVEQEARKVYDNWRRSIGNKDLYQSAHILIGVEQTAPESDFEAAKVRIDSVYAALKAGADFGELAQKVSDDAESAKRGGLLPWMSPGRTIKEFEDVAYTLQPGELSEPFQTVAGYHVVLMKARKQPEPYDSLRNEIIYSIERRNVRKQISNQKIADIVKRSEGELSKEQVMQNLADSLSEVDLDIRYLLKEYHDGLLLYEIGSRMVWDKAARDEVGLADYYKKHKKKYKWKEPRFRGIAYHVKTEDDKEGVKECVKHLAFDDWGRALKLEFNNDTILRIRVEKGIFKEGDNALIDRDVFGKDTEVKTNPIYPIDATYGKLLKKGPENYTDVRAQVTSDYQEVLEKAWVEELRKRYAFSVRKDVLSTVNKH